ncbi:techylectin-5B-like [Haliotis asinina]|uniref:techylectin-5B-like n=1 Tax=Haliotis asinina TaxID=109174 RepID=UPI003531DC11
MEEMRGASAQAYDEQETSFSTSLQQAVEDINKQKISFSPRTKLVKGAVDKFYDGLKKDKNYVEPLGDYKATIRSFIRDLMQKKWDTQVRNRCMNGGEYDQGKQSCQCYGGYIGQFCERIMQDCTEGYNTHHYNKGSGIFLIHPYMAPSPFKVKCRMEYGGNTYIQIHDDGSTHFNRSWQEYKDGFGDLTKDFWLGNDKIAYITNGRSQLLLFKTKDISSTVYRQRIYKSFTLSQDGLYTMTYERSWAHIRPEYIGGDCLAELKGQPFSTFDRDNDESPLNCAQEHQSGFWFKDCTPCNPNGVWSETPDKMRAGVPWEMFWTPVTGDHLILSCFAFLKAE